MWQSALLKIAIAIIPLLAEESIKLIEDLIAKRKDAIAKSKAKNTKV